QKSDVPEYTTGFAASIFGVIGATGATLVSVRATQKAVMLRLSLTAPGMAFGNSVIKFVGSNLFARLTGYPAIILSLFSDGIKAWRQNINGNTTASGYTFAGGLTMAIGSAVVLEGMLAVTGVTSVVPFAGWAAASLALIGAAIVVGALYLHAKAHEHVHSPIELWAARSIFGNRINDGELRPAIALDHERKLPSFPTLHAEIKAWHHERYRPKLITAEQAQSHGVAGLDSRWHQNDYWSPPNWTTLTHNEVPTIEPTVEFTVFLPGFIVGKSEWSGSLSGSCEAQGMIEFPLTPTCYFIDAGLILNFNNTMNKQKHASLDLVYRPNQGLDENSEINSNFLLER
ncbi:hypothetical protein ACIPFI_26895, partial [Pseudomonas sp. NPDC087039]